MDVTLVLDDQRLCPAAAMAFHRIAATMFMELAKAKGGDGPWRMELLERLRYEVATLEPPADADEELAEAWRETGLRAVDHIFEYLLFKRKADDR